MEHAHDFSSLGYLPGNDPYVQISLADLTEIQATWAGDHLDQLGVDLDDAVFFRHRDGGVAFEYARFEDGPVVMQEIPSSDYALRVGLH